MHLFDFDTGNAERMNTTAAVAITKVGFRQDGAMGVAGNQDMVFL